ncbi:MAG: indole-3-glycerol phosphate synthase TrpC [Candidatus Melainabacteria bacterium]|nr:indole-3-glycerol phosphate synthase TrpC [Candidatus Melainabacteria bacterium]
MNILEEIIRHKKNEVAKSKENLPLDKLKKEIKRHEYKRGSFSEALKEKIKKKEVGLIAEIKKASPSKGIIRADFNHIEIAKAYKAGGATCLSVLTDEKYFHGNLSYIKEIKTVVDLPILRKDFIVDPYQIYESVYNQSDCILLIVGAFCEIPLLGDLYEIACENEIDTLIEVHDEIEMEIALDLVTGVARPQLLGINNRDLKTFKTNLNTTKTLVKKYRRDFDGKIIVSESGIFTNKDIKSLIEDDVYVFLVGESLIAKKDIEEATKRLLSVYF